MRLLLIEDEQKIAQALQAGFTRLGFAVDVAGDADTGLRMASTGPYDALIIDRMLPDQTRTQHRDGLHIITELRDQKVHTPILILTAKDAVPDRVAGLGSGADDYLTKPFDFDELVARVKALLRRPKQTLDPTLRHADLTLNTSDHSATRAKQEIPLSAKEYALLEYLMRNAGKVVSKDELIEHVWNFDADVLPNTVEVYIGYLRNKIDKPFSSRPLIQTVRGVGYRLSAEGAHA